MVPLIRTADRDKANADPLDYRLWPVSRADLVNNLQALAWSPGALCWLWLTGSLTAA